MEATSFSARRVASSTLPGFSLPSPNTDVLSMAFLPPHVVFSRASPTSSPGASDGLSPGLSSINTASSQESQVATASLQYTYSNNWPPSTASPYHVTPSQTGHSYFTSAAPPLSGYHGSASSSQPLVAHVRPACEHGLHALAQLAVACDGDGGSAGARLRRRAQSFGGTVSSGGGGSSSSGGGVGTTGSGSHHNHHSLSPSHPAAHGSALLAPHQSTQATAPPSSSALVDAYGGHARSPSHGGYYAASATAQQSLFPSYPHHGGFSHSSPATAWAPRGLGHHGHGMAAPPPSSSLHGTLRGGYGGYASAVNGPVISNLHQPGSQMAVMPSMCRYRRCTARTR